MTKQSQVYSLSLGIILGSLVVLYSYSRYRANKPVPGIVDAYVINLDRATKRWDALQPQLKHLRPLPVHRWRAVDGHKLSEDQMLTMSIPEGMLPSHPSVEEGLKKRRKGEIGCWLSHVTLLKHLSTLHLPEDAAHLIIEDDVSIDVNTLDTWREMYQYLPSDWGMVYFGAGGEHLNVTNIQHGFGKLETGYGTYGYVVRHSMLPTILSLCKTMNGPIDIDYQKNYNTLHAYCLVNHTIHPKGDIQDSTIWNGHTK